MLSVDAGGCRVSELVDEVGNSPAASKSGNALKPSVNAIVRIGVEVALHFDVLKPALPTQNTSGEVHRANTKEQLSLDREDLW